MKEEERILARRGLEFFGKVSASISHEIKNVFAIVGESSGLMEDLLLMHSKKGTTVDPERFRTLLARIRKHLNRGDEIVKCMNRFAHSVDEPVKVVDLVELTRLVLSLASRFAALQGVALEPPPEEKGFALETDPFLLEQLLWICLHAAMAACDDAKRVFVHVEGNPGGAEVVLSGLRLPPSSFPEMLPTETKTLVKNLGAQLSTDGGESSIRLLLPSRLKDERGEGGQ